MSTPRLPVAIIGAGPVGLAAASHLLERGDLPLVLETGSSIANNIRDWQHVRMFTPWRYCVDAAARALLEKAGWSHPPMEAIPTGAELVRDYLEPLAALPGLAPHIHLGSRVVAVTRKGSDKIRTEGRDDLPFVLRVQRPDGSMRSFEARAVIDASGTWATPNPAGADGLPAMGEREAADRISYGIPDVLGAARSRYAGRTTAVIGGGHSALNALIDLAALRQQEPATRIIWVMRKQHIQAAYGGEDADGLPARGALGSQARHLVESGAVEVLTPFQIAKIDAADGDTLRVSGDHAARPASFLSNQMIVATGFRPELSMLREVRLALDPWLECAAALGPLIDPNLHSCGTVRPHGARELGHPDEGFFIAGMKSYGRAPTFLLATGHEQVRSIVAALAGDMEAAARVELELPETGVCSVPGPSRGQAATPAAASCCAPSQAPAVTPAASSCCGPGKAPGRAGMLRQGTGVVTVTIYHNPDCGTSRNTLGLIRHNGQEPVIIEYLKTPPSRDELVSLIMRMGISVRSLLREKGTPYDELGLSDPGLTDDQLLDAMTAHPILINRPIVVTPRGVKLCRPSDAVLDILPEMQRVLDASGKRIS